jgi:hypothetical protein
MNNLKKMVMPVVLAAGAIFSALSPAAAAPAQALSCPGYPIPGDREPVDQTATSTSIVHQQPGSSCQSNGVIAAGTRVNVFCYVVNDGVKWTWVQRRSPAPYIRGWFTSSALSSGGASKPCYRSLTVAEISN